MFYIDSDGVLSDFESWVEKYVNDISADEALIDKLMVCHYKDVFINVDRMIGSGLFFKMLKERNDCKVLTSVPDLKKLQKEFPDMKDLKKRVKQMRKNKYLWFKIHGVPKRKVIVVNGASNKIKYCKSNKDILIDDRPKNIKRWKEAGGIGILFPFDND